MEKHSRTNNHILKNGLQTKSLNKGDLVHEAGLHHTTPGRIIEVIEHLGSRYYRIHFKCGEILKRIILPDFRLQKYEQIKSLK